MMAVTLTPLKANEWLERWDTQQAHYLPTREQRFEVMFEVLEVLYAPTVRVLDLCAGPASLSRRLLDYFPQATAVAVDYDPVLLHLGQTVEHSERLSWHEANVTQADWHTGLGEFDAVLTTTALHWLTHEQLLQLYRDVHGLLKPGGVLLNGDHLRFDPSQKTAQKLADQLKTRRQGKAWQAGGEDWATWWQALEQEEGLGELFAERERRFPPRSQTYTTAPSCRFHQAALLDAGFTEADVIWQNMDNRIVMGRKG